MPDFFDEATWRNAYGMNKQSASAADIKKKRESEAANKKFLKKMDEEGLSAFARMGGSKSARSRNMKKRSYKKNQKKGGKSKRRTRHVKRRSATKKSRKHGKK